MAGVNTPQADKKDDAMTSVGKAFSIARDVQGMSVGKGGGDADKKARAEAMKRRQAALTQINGVDTEQPDRSGYSSTV